MPNRQFGVLFERIAALATAGPLAIPIWIAFLFILLSFLRGPLLSAVFRMFHINDDTLMQTVRRRLDGPLQLLFVTLALLPFTFNVGPPYGKLVVLLAHVFASFLTFHILIQIVDLSVFNWYLNRTRANVSAVMRFFTLLVLYAVAIMLLLDWEVGVSVLPLLATSTVLTAVLGLALQDTLKNAFAGLNMSIENSFEQGDWVMFRLNSNDQMIGQIVEIGWRTTKIRTLNNNYAVIPNASFTTCELINYNKPSTLHARTVEVPVRLGAEPEKVRKGLEQAALAVDGVLPEPLPQATPVTIQADRIIYQLRFWMTEIEQREQLTGKVLEKCWLELKDLGALY